MDEDRDGIDRNVRRQYPIVLGPMGGVSGGHLAATVSNVAGLGLVGGSHGDPAWLRTKLSRVKEARQNLWKGTLTMDENMYPNVTKDLAQKRRELAPEVYAAFRTFSQRVFAEGALPSKTKQLIAVAVAHVTQCPYCIRGHTEFALKEGDAMHQAETKPRA